MNIITLKSKSEIKPEERHRIAKKAANVFMGEESNYIPYMPMENDTSFWSIDPGNDFWILFDQIDNSKFWLKCRYEYQQELLKAFAKFFALKTRCEIIA
jgi:hypothetical protein